MRSETTLHFPAVHPAFAGHFPGNPLVPGVLLLDAAIHAMHELLRPGAAAQPGEPAPACQVGAAKFLSPVGPGDTVTISLDATAAGPVRFEISCDGRKVATGTLLPPTAP